MATDLEEITPNAVRDYLVRSCYGRANGRSISGLAQAICGETTPGIERRLRAVIQGLRLAGYPIAAQPTTGYFWADSPEEMQECLKFLRSRALCSLKQVSRLLRFGVPLLAGQLEIPLGVEPVVTVKDFYPQGQVSLVVEMPPDLHGAMGRYLEQSHLGQDDLIRRALAEFLILRGMDVPRDLLIDLEDQE